MAQLLAAPGGVENTTAAPTIISHALPSSSGPSAGIPSSPTVALKTKQVQHHLAPGKGKGRADTPTAYVKEPATGLEATDLRSLVNLTNKQRAFLLKGRDMLVYMCQCEEHAKFVISLFRSWIHDNSRSALHTSTPAEREITSS
jgi:hypothetical protein